MENQSNHDVDWKLIKAILCGIAESLKMVCDKLPQGTIKVIVCSMASLLMLVCQSIPDNKQAV